MKPWKCLSFLIVCALLATQAPPASAQFDNILKGLKKAVGGSQGISQGEMVEGLKEALKIGTGNAVQNVSQLDGYYGNSSIRIPLPGMVQKAESILRATGYGSQVDAFLLSMNRAAERAAPEAKALFGDAIMHMTFDDASRILHGRDNEATLYFQEKTQDRLHHIFKPIIQNAMSEVGVTRSYQNLTGGLQNLPLVGQSALDLDQYVTDKALEGLFFMVGEEERKIRQNPAARVTDLLKKVFGNT